MHRGRVPGVVLAALLGLLALAPAPAAAAGAKPLPAGRDVASAGPSVVSSVGEDVTPTRRRLLPVRRPATAAPASRKPSGAARLALALPTGVGPDVQVTPATTGNRYTEPAVAIDPDVTTGDHLAASSIWLTGTAQIAHTSADGGSSWATQVLAGPLVYADPGVAYDATSGVVNQVFYSALAADHGQTEVALLRQNTDGTGGFGMLIDQNRQPDRPMVATDPRAGMIGVYIGYDTNPADAGSGQPLVVASLHDLSGSGTGGSQVWNSGGDFGAWPTVGADGTVYVVWDDYCGNTPTTLAAPCAKPSGQILLSKSTDLGNTWLSTPIHLTDTTTGFGSILPNYATDCTAGCPARPVGPSPQIAIDHSGGARNGTMYLVYADGADRQLGASTVPSAHRMHAFLQESKDGGATWSSRVRLDSGNTNDAWEPTVAVDQSNGDVVVAWYDRRDDPSNKLYRPYYTESTVDSNGLAQFTDQLPLADVQSDPTVDCNGTGDYMQIAAAAGTAHPVWTDMRTGLPAIFTSAVTEATATTTSAVVSVTGVLRDPHGTGWQPLGGLATDIGVGGDCQAWVIGVNQVPGGGGVWAWEGPSRGWVSFVGGGERISTTSFGLPRVVNSAGGVYRMLNDGSWQTLPGAGLEIASGPDFSLWIVGLNPVGGGHGLWAFNGSGWDAWSGGGERIAIGPDGLPWVVNAWGSIWHLTATGWQQLPGLAHDIGVGADGSAWIIGLNPVGGGYGIYRWNGGGWDAVDGGGVAISVGPDGLPWVVSSTGGI